VVAGAALTQTAASAAPGRDDVAPGSNPASAAPSVSASLSPAVARRSEVPSVVSTGKATRVAALPKSQMLRLTLGLNPRNAAQKQAFLQAVQDKSSPQFHHFLTPQEWDARFAPSAADEQQVVAWARSAGLTVTQRFANRLVVDVEGDSGTVSRAFGVHLSTYRDGSRAFFSNDAAPTLPEAVSKAVLSVQGLSNYGQLKPVSPSVHEPAFASYAAGPTRAAQRPARADAVPSAVAKLKRAVAARNERAASEHAPRGTAGSPTPSITGGAYDPTDIYSSQAYNNDGLTSQGHCCNPTHLPSTGPQTSIAIATAGAQQISDMAGFHNQYPYLAYNVQQFFIDGTPAQGDGEGTMDMEWATALSNSYGSFQDTAKVYMYDGVNNAFSTFTDIWNHMLSDNLARTMSSSWGCAEVTCYSTSTIATDHAIFDAMIGQGWTLVVASGDHGAYQDLTTTQRVNYPASDPDVVAAGGTTLRLASGPVFQSETAWAGGPAGAASNDGGGGGGCSAVFGRPSYQANITLCGTTGRDVPDLSLNADWFNTPQNMYMGGLSGNGGTSIVAPELAGFFAQENAYLLSEGHGPLGNPLPQLYSIGAGGSPHNPYYDITSGCTSNDIGPGFCGIPGYDRATGWGSANLLQLAWALNWQLLPDAGRPGVSFSGPTTGQWYNTDQVVSWNVADTGSPPSGVAGFSRGWDSVPSDPASVTNQSTAAGTAFNGPQFPNATSGSLGLASAGQGCHTAEVEAWDNMGLQSGVSTYGSLCFDSVAPTITRAPSISLISGVQLTTAGVPARISWNGSDTTSGIASYSLRLSKDGAAFTPVFTGNATSRVLTLQGGHTYRFQVSARDVAGNSSSALAGATKRVSVFQEGSTALSFSTGWTTVNQTGASGGKVKRATRAGQTARLTFRGTQAAWVTTRGTSHGAATVRLDAATATSVDTHATATRAAYVTGLRTGTAAAHTYTVRVTGTAGHPAVDVDGFVVLS
jgi:hypothetical protein